jgi:hypothetical protein
VFLVVLTRFWARTSQDFTTSWRKVVCTPGALRPHGRNGGCRKARPTLLVGKVPDAERKVDLTRADSCTYRRVYGLLTYQSLLGRLTVPR